MFCFCVEFKFLAVIDVLLGISLYRFDLKSNFGVVCVLPLLLVRSLTVWWLPLIVGKIPSSGMQLLQCVIF